MKLVKWLQVVVFDVGRNISMTINSKCPLAGNSFWCRFLLRQAKFLAYLWQSLTVLYTLLDRCGQPAEFALHSVVHEQLAGESRRFPATRELKEVWKKGFWHHILFHPIK